MPRAKTGPVRADELHAVARAEVALPAADANREQARAALDDRLAGPRVDRDPPGDPLAVAQPQLERGRALARCEPRPRRAARERGGEARCLARSVCDHGRDPGARPGSAATSSPCSSRTSRGPTSRSRSPERILAACAAPGAAGDQHAARVSIGIGLGGGDGAGADELLRRADLAMYAAKHAGGGRLQLFEPALEAEVTAGDQRDRPSWLRRSDEQAEEVRSLLARPDGLAIVFQPIMDLRTGAIVAYEALARFNSAVQRAPDAWFAQAHRCGLGYELEARAVAAALAVPGLPSGIRVSVNLSPSALASEAVAAVLPADLVRHDDRDHRARAGGRQRGGTGGHRACPCRPGRGWPSTTPGPATPASST